MKLRLKYNAGFTMVEIAIAIGVIAFALIAIMGVMPSGMQVQRDNRQDTIVNQDGAYLLEAIRNSAEGVVDLRDFAEIVDNMPVPTNYTSADIIALMSEPDRLHTNVFRAISGPATQRGGPDVPTFRYLVLSEVRQLGNVNTNMPLAQWQAVSNNTFEVRLVFLWPLRPNSTIPAEVVHKQVFRTTIAGIWESNRFDTAQFVRP